jgi:predicted HAD superfamily Cof-like phosphohydrolase
MYDDIRKFHEKFGLDYKGPPREIAGALEDFRARFMQEELDEFCDAESLEKKLDALVDLVYVALGTAYLYGFDFDEAWRRVHEANMKKVRAQPDGSDSARQSMYDVVKPAGWTAPDLSDLTR